MLNKSMIFFSTKISEIGPQAKLIRILGGQGIRWLMIRNTADFVIHNHTQGNKLVLNAKHICQCLM